MPSRHLSNIGLLVLAFFPGCTLSVANPSGLDAGEVAPAPARADGGHDGAAPGSPSVDAASPLVDAGSPEAASPSPNVPPADDGGPLDTPGQPFTPGPSTGPSWVQSASGGAWTSVPSQNGTLSASGVLNPISPSWPSFGNRHAAITEAWNSGVINTVGVHDGTSFVPGTHLIITGGGHADYDGNELYAFGPIDSDQARWRRLRNATLNVTAGISHQSDGSPTQRHTYDSLVYVPTRNWMVMAGAAALVGTGNENSPSVDRFDFDAVPSSGGAWAKLSPLPSLAQVSTEHVAAYHPKTDQIWHCFQNQNGSPIRRLDLASNTWSSFAQNESTSNLRNPASAIDPDRDLWVAYGGGGLWAVDLRSPAAAKWFQVTTTGTGPSSLGGIVFDPVDKVFVVWADSGRTLYRLQPAANPYAGGGAWTWSAVTPSIGAVPSRAAGLAPDTAGYATGTFKRFSYVPSPRGYVLMNRIGDPVYFFKP